MWRLFFDIRPLLSPCNVPECQTSSLVSNVKYLDVCRCSLHAYAGWSLINKSRGTELYNKIERTLGITSMSPPQVSRFSYSTNIVLEENQITCGGDKLTIISVQSIPRDLCLEDTCCNVKMRNVF